MIFKRRDPRPLLLAVTEAIYPRRGWWRAVMYVVLRLRRLPDPPHRIGRGVAAGVFISFSPLFGFHLIGAWLIALAIRGNVIAALLATFFGNPVTYPIFAYFSVWLGHWMLGMHTSLGMAEIVDTFKVASVEFWDNIKAIFTAAPTGWAGMRSFFHTLFLPYLLGSLPTGLAAAVASHYMTLPLVDAYKKRRTKKLRERVEKLRQIEAGLPADAKRAGSAPKGPLEGSGDRWRHR